MPEKKSKDADGAIFAKIELPLLVTGQRPPEFISLTMITWSAEKRAVRALFDGLHSRHAQLNDGSHVNTPLHAMRWLLQQVAKQIDEQAESKAGDPPTKAR